MRYAHLGGREASLAAVFDDSLVGLDGLAGDIRTVDDLIAAGPAAWREAQGIARRAANRGQRLDDTELASPLLSPSKIVCVGLNYHDHAQETKLDLPQMPLLFAKFPSTLIGPGEPITWPEGLTSQVDWEAELAVVVGVRMRRVDAQSALGGVFGYTAANDVSARDLQFTDGQWTRGKSLDTFCPLGPAIVTPEEFGDPQAHRLWTRVNGRTMQDSTTAQMIFGVAEILSFASHAFTLEPGDLVLTGTPAGVGGFRSPPVFLQPGDVVEVEVEGIGILSNPVIAAGEVPAERAEASGALRS